MIQKDIYTHVVDYRIDDVRVCWHYGDSPSKCGFCSKEVNYYLATDIPYHYGIHGTICPDCLKKLNKIMRAYNRDIHSNTNK